MSLVPVGLPLRLAVAVVMVVWGAWTDRRWTVPLAAGLAVPALYAWSFLGIWIGVIGITWSSNPTVRSVVARLRVPR